MKHHQPTPFSRAARRIPSALLVAFVMQSGFLHGGEIVSSESATTPSGRDEDRLSPAEFAEPPAHVRPGAFWDWLNGSITKEQITRDLEAMKLGGMRGAEIRARRMGCWVVPLGCGIAKH